ncbi:MAG: DUF4872 domain-containing protein, partial [Candidatus Hodarchaeales archaeon]
GTGGGLFRYLFSNFLAETAEELNDESLRGLSRFYTKLGERWEKCAQLFTDLGEGLIHNQKASTINQIKDELAEIKNLEEKGAKDLINFSL